jgi:hypothetical protein
MRAKQKMKNKSIKKAESESKYKEIRRKEVKRESKKI